MERIQAPSHRLSCRRCQTRKIKCDRKQPCSNCVYHKSSCEFRTHDSRRRPVAHAYVAALEARVAWYESLVRKLKDADVSEVGSILDGVTLDDHLGPPNISAQAPADDTASEEHASSPGAVGSLKQGASGTLQYHGPTSVYLDEGLDDPVSLDPPRDISSAHSWSDLRLATALGIDNALINESLALFFTHHYSQFMFVYREAFLSDYFTSEHGGKYWSLPLLYALSALGAVHSSEPRTRTKAFLLAKCAEEIIITYELGRPTFTTVQALLCLGFHELGHGNSSKGWLLSGMAFRMGQDLGFHRDPRLWISKDSSILTANDVEIRRRIYWGCYLADKFISLYMGRPVSLMERDAEVEPVEPLPDFPDDHQWFGLTDLASDFSRTAGMRPQLTLGFRHLVVLGGIFQDIMAVIFSPKSRADQSSILNHLGQFNLKLNRWHSALPESLQWSQWSPQPTVEPHILILHIFYHSIMLSVNRHFIDTSAHARFSPNQQSQTACATSCDTVIAMTRQFRNQPGTHQPPIALLYALTTVAITIVTATGRERSQHDGRLPFIIKVLTECSTHFRLASEMRSKLVRYLQMPAPTVESNLEAPSHPEFYSAAPNAEASGNTPSREETGGNPLLLSGFPPGPTAPRSQPGVAAPGLPSVAFPDLEGLGQFGDSFLSDSFQDWFFQT